VAAERVGIPMLEEHLGVGVHEVSEPPNSVGRAIRAVIVVPARHLALVLVANAYVGRCRRWTCGRRCRRSNIVVQRTVLDLVPRLQLKAFVTECWVPDGGFFIRVVERDVVLIRRALSSANGRHTTVAGRGGLAGGSEYML